MIADEHTTYLYFLLHSQSDKTLLGCSLCPIEAALLDSGIHLWSFVESSLGEWQCSQSWQAKFLIDYYFYFIFFAHRYEICPKCMYFFIYLVMCVMPPQYIPRGSTQWWNTSGYIYYLLHPHDKIVFNIWHFFTQAASMYMLFWSQISVFIL